MPIIFTPAEDRTRDSLHVNPNLYRAAMKAGLYRKAVQMCCVPNTSTYSGIHRGYLPPSVAGSYQICKIFFFFFFFFFSVTGRSFRVGSHVHSLTFGDVKRRGLDRRSSDLII